MYAEPAMPMPRPAGSRPFFSRQPDFSMTRSKQVERPMVRTFIWFAVMVPGATVFRRRHSAGSIPRSAQILSMWHSSA